MGLQGPCPLSMWTAIGSNPVVLVIFQGPICSLCLKPAGSHNSVGFHMSIVGVTGPAALQFLWPYRSPHTHCPGMQSSL